MGDFRFGDPRLPRRFWVKVIVNPVTGCWEWTGRLDRDGYGDWFHVSGRDDTRYRERPHRHAYQVLVGPIPAGLTLNHQCHVPRCVNPSDGHACEPMTAGANAREARLRRTHCPSNHPYSLGNTLWTGPRRNIRQCRMCAESRAARKARRAVQIAGQLSLTG